MRIAFLLFYVFLLGCSGSFSQSYYLFYPYTEKDDAGYQWPFNSRYHSGDSGCYAYAAVTFDPFVVLKNDTEFLKIDPPKSYLIDTIYIAYSHENNSGKADTLICKMVNIGKDGKPGKRQIWADTVITTKGLSKKNDWKNGYTHSLFKPNVKMIGTSFALVFEYYGDRTDTLGFRAIYEQDLKRDSINTYCGYVYPGMRPKITGTNWMKAFPGCEEICSSSELLLPGNKGYTFVQHWDFYVKLKVLPSKK